MFVVNLLIVFSEGFIVNPLTYIPLFVSCPACRDPQCKAEQGGLFMRPQVSYSTWQMFNRGNWSRDRPSPDCLCSTEDVRRMLPDCPQGAGGLPPPQVCVCHQSYFLHAKVKLYTCLFCFCGSKIKLMHLNIQSYKLKIN